MQICWVQIQHIDKFTRLGGPDAVARQARGPTGAARQARGPKNGEKCNFFTFLFNKFHYPENLFRGLKRVVEGPFLSEFSHF